MPLASKSGQLAGFMFDQTSAHMQEDNGLICDAIPEDEEYGTNPMAIDDPGREIEITDMNLRGQERVSAANFHLLSLLGQGSFGKVYLAKKKRWR